MPELNQRLEEVKDSLDDERKRKLQKWKRNLLDTVEHEGEEAVARRLKDAHILQLVEDEFFKELEGLTEKGIVQSYLETNRERIKDEIPSSTDDSFEVEQYEGLNKTELAREMARHCVDGKKIIPVDYGVGHDQKTKFYKYDREEGYYKPYSENKIGTLCTKMAGKKDSTHLEREFKRCLRNYGFRKSIDELGLPENKILVKNSKVLDISDPSNPDVSNSNPDDYAIHKVNVNYSPQEDCPEFKKFVWQIFDNDKESVRTLQEFLGWLLKYPNSDFKKALLILGDSNTGKSQLTEIVEAMFDDKSVTNLSMMMLGMKRTFHVSKLQEKIVNMDKDMGGQTIEAPNYVKTILGQENIEAEDKGSNAMDVQPTAKHLICSNVSPRIENTDDTGFYSRFLTLKTPNVVPKEDRIPNLGLKLFEKESSGILNWMLDGLARLEDEGQFTLQREPHETKNLWNEYGNSVHKFVWYECEATGDDSDFIPYEILYEMYENWVNSRLEDRKSKREFKKVMREQQLFVKQKRRFNGIQKRGIGGIKVPEYDDMFSS